MRAHLEEQALDAAADDHGALGLAAVDEGIEGDGRNDGHEMHYGIKCSRFEPLVRRRLHI
jgi:hypothetical protein